MRSPADVRGQDESHNESPAAKISFKEETFAAFACLGMIFRRRRRRYGNQRTSQVKGEGDLFRRKIGEAQGQG
jgi:hypothetical protein